MGTKQRLFKYSVIKYVPDDVRDEAINVGVLLRSTEDKKFDHKVVTNFGKFRKIPDAPILKEALEKLINEYDGAESLEDMYKKMNHKIRLSIPRSMMVNNLEEDKKALFDEFVSVRDDPAKESVPDMIRQHIWDSIKSKDGATYNKPVKGKESTFVFDYYYKNGDPKFVSVMAFTSIHALNKTKAFDWSVLDIMNVHKYKIGSFLPLLVEPRGHHTGNTARGYYDQAVGILDDRGYHFSCVNGNDSWRDKVDSFLQI
ncbi:hypothetical protein IBTHAUMO2_870001 [Nitrosopumilaceae archaeon]|nr:DUF3037 domain-containing protein [Nitrosopumilus sp.]MDA7997494.1 DUF3037 domain-containing protein [Nitrosopumilus sp.]CAI9832586.1 hypothetical protein IBTHAUMO2_870001 [Nitrosopumilaceae archaeon]